MAAIIRPPLVSELPAVLDVEKDVYGSYAYPDFFFRQALDLWRDTFLVAAGAEGSVDGYVVGAPGNEPGVRWVLSLAVRRACRGRGIGKALMVEVLAAMRAGGASAVKLTVHPANGAATLYRNLGFVVVAEDPRYFGEDEPRLVMERRFDPA